MSPTSYQTAPPRITRKGNLCVFTGFVKSYIPFLAMADQPRISMIIPVFNEEENLPILHAEIQKALQDSSPYYEILLIDDGSRDRSLEVIRSLSARDPRVRYLSFAANCGQSAAFAAGFREARGDLLVTMDADLQNDPQDIPRLLEVFGEGYDMVIGWRAQRRDTWIKRVASKIANRVRNTISRETVRDTGCSLKVMRGSMARQIPMFTGMHRFLPTLMKMQGARVAEVQVHHRPRKFGASKYGILDRALSATYDLFAVRWMQKRHIDYRIKERS
jgi:dolichol-phosphate mannosyltransferase